MYTPPKKQLAWETSKQLGSIARVTAKGMWIHTINVSGYVTAMQSGKMVLIRAFLRYDLLKM